ncbi:MAG: hypothetical protein QWI73_07000, partial [Alphaproteobacteria bacterium]|nr:hypothetical protein [Alphaproteobacteria bacterium]
MNDKHEGKVEKIEEWVDESSEGKGSSAEEGESSEGEDSDEEEEYIRKHFAVEQEKTKKQCNEMHLIKKFDNNSINL